MNPNKSQKVAYWYFCGKSCLQFRFCFCFFFLILFININNTLKSYKMKMKEKAMKNDQQWIRKLFTLFTQIEINYRKKPEKKKHNHKALKLANWVKHVSFLQGRDQMLRRKDTYQEHSCIRPRFISTRVSLYWVEGSVMQ